MFSLFSHTHMLAADIFYFLGVRKQAKQKLERCAPKKSANEFKVLSDAAIFLATCKVILLYCIKICELHVSITLY